MSIHRNMTLNHQNFYLVPHMQVTASYTVLRLSHTIILDI